MLLGAFPLLVTSWGNKAGNNQNSPTNSLRFKFIGEISKRKIPTEPEEEKKVAHVRMQQVCFQAGQKGEEKAKKKATSL